MSKNRLIGIASWALLLILCNVLMFCLVEKFTASFWITFGFVWVSLILSLIVQLWIWKKSKSPDEQFLHMPTFSIIFVYMIIQAFISVILAICSSVISYKVSIVINVIVFIIAWIIILGSIAGNDHIRKVNERQKDHHVEL